MFVGKVYATATEDMDALTFGTPLLLRNVTAAEARKLPIVEIDLSVVLKSLKMTQDEVTINITMLTSVMSRINIFLFLLYCRISLYQYV